jgi:hypothetical protein
VAVRPQIRLSQIIKRVNATAYAFLDQPCITVGHAILVDAARDVQRLLYSPFTQ